MEPHFDGHPFWAVALFHDQKIYMYVLVRVRLYCCESDFAFRWVNRKIILMFTWAATKIKEISLSRSLMLSVN